MDKGLTHKQSYRSSLLYHKRLAPASPTGWSIGRANSAGRSHGDESSKNIARMTGTYSGNDSLPGGSLTFYAVAFAVEITITRMLIKFPKASHQDLCIPLRLVEVFKWFCN